MKSNIDTKNKLTLISQIGDESKFQILQYNHLRGVHNYKSISIIRSIENSGERLKQVRIELNNSSVKIQDDSVSYIKGNINTVDKSNLYKGLKSLFCDKKSNQYLNLKTTFRGSGEILLQPSFEDFTLIELIDEEIIINDSIFYACDDEIKVSIEEDKSKIKLSGSGNIVLKLPAPRNEIIRCKLFNDELTITDDIVILQSKDIKVKVEAFEKIIDDNIKNETFKKYKGIGEVWILPTKAIYDKYNKINDSHNNKTYQDTEEKYI